MRLIRGYLLAESTVFIDGSTDAFIIASWRNISQLFVITPNALLSHQKVRRLKKQKSQEKKTTKKSRYKQKGKEEKFLRSHKNDSASHDSLEGEF